MHCFRGHQCRENDNELQQRLARNICRIQESRNFASYDLVAANQIDRTQPIPDRLRRDRTSSWVVVCATQLSIKLQYRSMDHTLPAIINHPWKAYFAQRKLPMCKESFWRL